jgi:glycosyltransferase involved in cell wall biosynthesis
VAGFLRRGHGFKTVWQINNNTNPKRLMGLGVRLNHAMARWGADLLLPASRYIANNWLASGVRTHVIHNAAEPRFAEPNALDAPPIRCVIAGRLEESKGHHLAVEAVLAARREGLSITLDIFGGPLDDNPYAAGLKQRIAAENAESFVSFMGFRSDLRDLHQNYHLGLQCRIDPEPCSLWVCETLVDGLPLVASASGGTPELVDDGVTGLLFEPGNQSAITEKVIALCRNPARLAQWRRAAFERGAAHFRSSRMMSESVDCYRSLLR